MTYHVGRDGSIPGVVIRRILGVPLIRTVPIVPSLKKLLMDILLFAKAFRLLLKGRYDLLHTHEAASMFRVPVAKLFRVRRLYDIHSSLPRQLTNFRSKRFYPLFLLFE